MSRQMGDEERRCGVSLLEEGRVRLERLGTQVELLRHLAQPRVAGDDSPPLGSEHWSSCLELLAEQLDQLRRHLSWPVHRTAMADGAEATSDAPMSSEEPFDAAPYTDPGIQDERMVFGITLDQWDALDRLTQMLQAHGDVVSASNMADYARGTLTMVGHAIFDGAIEVREILNQVEMQQLPEMASPRADVAEDQAGYLTGFAPDVTVDRHGRLPSSHWRGVHAGKLLH